MLGQLTSETQPELTEARMKVIDPLLSSGPSSCVQISRRTGSEIWIRTPHRVLVGATVHLRMGAGIFFGEVRDCEATGGEHEIRVVVKESF